MEAPVHSAARAVEHPGGIEGVVGREAHLLEAPGEEHAAYGACGHEASKGVPQRRRRTRRGGGKREGTRRAEAEQHEGKPQGEAMPEALEQVGDAQGGQEVSEAAPRADAPEGPARALGPGEAHRVAQGPDGRPEGRVEAEREGDGDRMRAVRHADEGHEGADAHDAEGEGGRAEQIGEVRPRRGDHDAHKGHDGEQPGHGAGRQAAGVEVPREEGPEGAHGGDPAEVERGECDAGQVARGLHGRRGGCARRGCAVQGLTERSCARVFRSDVTGLRRGPWGTVSTRFSATPGA
jgi:hypothetical protein